MTFKLAHHTQKYDEPLLLVMFGKGSADEQAGSYDCGDRAPRLEHSYSSTICLASF